MSWLKAAATGFSAAGAQVANKYLDQQLAQQRAEFMAQLQRRTAGEIRQDDAAFRDQRAPIERERTRQDLLAQGAATREAAVAGWSDTTFQSARRSQEEADAAAKRGERVKDLNAETPILMDRARQEADIRGRIQAKWSNSGKQTIADKIKEMEAAIGRPLTAAEKEGVAGLGKKPADDPSKAAIDAVLAGVKDGTIKPEEVGPKVNAIVKSLRVTPMEEDIRNGLSRARAEGKAAEAIAELRQAGFSDQQLLAAGVTPSELKGAAPQMETKPAQRSLMDRALTGRGAPNAQATLAPSRTTEQRIAEIRAALAKDDAMKSAESWKDGIGMKVLQGEAAFLAVAERRALEDELARLTKGR